MDDAGILAKVLGDIKAMAMSSDSPPKCLVNKKAGRLTIVYGESVPRVEIVFYLKSVQEMPND